MKNKSKITGIIIAVILDLAVVGVLVSEWMQNGSLESTSIFRAILLFASSVLFVYRMSSRGTFGSAGARHKQYEDVYGEYISAAFVRPEQKKDRKRLMLALDLFNAGNYSRSIDVLEKLRKECRKPSEIYAVDMFRALSYSRLGASGKARDIYTALVEADPSRSTVHSNLGMIFESEGNYAEAEECYRKAIAAKPENPNPYNNLAALYLNTFNYEDAAENAKQALALKNNMYQASNTLAIVYTIMGEFDEADKYFKISVSNGVDPKELSEAINRYVEKLD